MAGLRPIRHLTGGTTFRTKLYPAVVSGAMYVGDPVRVSAGVVKPLGTSTAACLGAVAYVLDANKKPKTFALPGGNIGKAAGVSGWVAVYDDPDIIYEVECDATVSSAFIGRAHGVSAGTPVTAGGQSGYRLKASAGTAADVQFRVIGPSPSDIDDNGLDSRAEVVIHRHTYKIQS